MPDPNKYDGPKAEDDFMGDCVSQAVGEGKGQDQAVAMCSSMWSERKSKPAILKTDTDKQIVRKTHVSDDTSGLEFILSDASIDRYDDSIDSAGWELTNFKRNPIALFGHDGSFPIGRWENLSVKNTGLHGHLRLAPEGTSARIDEIRKLVDAGILRAVSVGFRPLEAQPMTKGSGTKYVRSELVECSLVAIPANVNALQVARSLNVSREVQDMVFAKEVKTTQRPEQRSAPVQRNDQSQPTIDWQGQKIPVERFEQGVWNGQKIYRY